MTEAPDIIIRNGRLITFDPEQPDAQALAITGGTLSAVGNDAEIAALAGENTRIIDAQGGTVLPGFIDSHVHLFGGSVELSLLSLYGVQGLDEKKAHILPYAEANPDDDLVFCVMADYDILGTGQTLTRHDLDQIIADRPLAVFAPDHHTIWANTAALQAANLLDGGTVDAGSQIVMGADGKASGALLEPGAYGPILEMTRNKGRDMLGLVTGRDPFPAATPAEREMDKDAIEQGLLHCAGQGITGLHLMDGNRYQLELLSELEVEGRLHCRTMVPFHFKGTDDIARIVTEGVPMRDAYQGDKVWCGHMKMFIDGVVESGTALMLEPYPGDMGAGGNTGEEVFTQDHFVAAACEADKHGFQIAVHAIGDAGVRRTIDAFEVARETNGKRDSRHRIEHLEVMHPADIPRLNALDIVASIQPGHAPCGHIFAPGAVGDYLHRHQIEGAYAWQTIRDTGAKMVFSTDWPVMPVNVMDNIKAAIAPLDLGPDWPDQSQTLMDTLASYTRDNAWVEFNEHRKGQLSSGMMADVVILTEDITAVSPADVPRVHAMVTICDGTVTFERSI
ncbi:Amidohydrolase 3 [Sulfitobacter noctilucae]|uniref:amidohydrolase n=1 Tax=Sulfitobacter noctilucae TaxID=1342302 RepID=UPI000469E588|nr:amidohydrolase [Sulfitobacter noctilucae]KIN70468.1 Amidohydrolase 3 [Sulfitobacter noctilucae]